MFTMMIDVKAVDNVREMLIANNTQVRKVKKSFINPFSFANLSRSNSEYYTVNGVLMPR